MTAHTKDHTVLIVLQELTSNYVTGRNRETQRLVFLRRTEQAVIGGRFRGSKISNGWLKSLGFNPKIDLWWTDKTGVTHFEQLKTARHGSKATISNDEIAAIQQFADRFYNFNSIWVGYVTKVAHKPYQEYRLN